MVRRLQQRQIEAFHAVIELGAVSAAATYMHVTQPAVSHLIRALEESVGFKLFERRGRKLVPNADGLLLHEEVQRSMAALSSIEAHADAIRERRVGRIRIAAMPAYVDGLAARVVGDFLVENPGIFMEIESYDMVRIVEMVETGRFELGIIGVPSDHPLLRVHHSLDSEAVLVMHPDHPLAGKKDIALEDLGGQNFISIGSGSPFRYEIDLVLRRLGVAPKVIAEVRTQRAIMQMIRAGVGVSLIDRKLAQEQSGTGLVIRETRPMILWKICLITKRQRQPSRALESLIARMNQSMST